MSGSKSTSRTGSAQTWARPFAKTAATEAQGVFNANQGTNQMLASSVSGLVPGLVDKYNAGNAAVDGATSHVSDLLSGKYLSGNPQLEAIIGKVRGGVTDQVNSQFSAAGRYGSGGHTGVLADSLSEAEAGLRYNDYNTQSGRMDAAAAQAPALAQADYAGLAELLQTAGVGAELPYAGLEAYSGALANLFNGGYSKDKQSALGQVAGAVGSGLGAAASAGAFSDRRLKTAIRKIGEYADGLGKYEWRYIWGGPVQSGVMAEEVAQLRPWALGAEVGGFKTVHYALLEAA